jgi:hypothetical protein
MANIGNWSGNQSSYSTRAVIDLLYAPINATYNNITNLNTSKANLASPVFTGTVTMSGMNTTNNVTITGITTGTPVCIFATNSGCLIKANSTCTIIYSPDGLTASKIANNGTVC